MSLISNVLFIDSPSSSLDHTHSLSPVRKRSSSQTSSQSNSVSRRRRSSSLDRPVKVSRQDDKNEHDDEHDDDVVPAATIQRIKLPPEEKKYANNTNNEHYRKGESGRGTRGGDEVYLYGIILLFWLIVCCIHENSLINKIPYCTDIATVHSLEQL